MKSEVIIPSSIHSGDASAQEIEAGTVVRV